MIRARRCEHVWRAARAALSAVCLFLIDPQSAAAGSLKGVALAIGQSDYETLEDLPNTVRDADAIELLLSELGFDANVTSERDAKRLRRDLDIFMDDASEADVAVLYYAGHAVEIGGENFLVPTDIQASSLATLGEKLISLTDYIDRLRQKAKITIVFLDACRNNPFPPGAIVKLSPESAPAALGAGGLQSRSIVVLGSETRRADEGFGTVIAFAAEPGKVALDGDAGGNSPYAAAILRHLPAMTGEEFGTVMRMVAEEVYLKTGGKQRPWVNESLRRLLYFGQAPEPLKGEEGDILKERRRLLVTISTLPDADRRRVERVAADAGVPMDSLYGMLKALGADKPQDPRELDHVLRVQTDKLKEIMADRAALKSRDSEIVRLSNLVDEALADGALDAAIALHERAKRRLAEFRATLDQSEADLKARRIEAAAVYARSAETYDLVSDYARAAEDYRLAFEQVERWDDRLAFRYKIGQADAIASAWDFDGYSVAELYRSAERFVTRQDAPLDWAELQHKLGLAVWSSGKRSEARRYLALALEERKRDLVPLAWAETQKALGDWYRTGKSPADLTQAVTHYGLALEIYDSDRTAFEWSDTQERLGDCLASLGRQSGNLSTLRQAVAAYEVISTSLRYVNGGAEWSWSAAEEKIGDVSWQLYERSPASDRMFWLNRAANAWLNALKSPFPGTDPAVIATLQNSAGFSLTLLGELESDPEYFEKATPLLREAVSTLETWGRLRSSTDYETQIDNTRDSLCRALLNIGVSKKLRAALVEARQVCEASIAGQAKRGDDGAETRRHLGNVEKALAAIE